MTSASAKDPAVSLKTPEVLELELFANPQLPKFKTSNETRWFCSVLIPLRTKCVIHVCLEMVPCAWFVVSRETTFDIDRVGLEPRAQARRASDPFVIG